MTHTCFFIFLKLHVSFKFINKLVYIFLAFNVTVCQHPDFTSLRLVICIFKIVDIN